MNLKQFAQRGQARCGNSELGYCVEAEGCVNIGEAFRPVFGAAPRLPFVGFCICQGLFASPSDYLFFPL